MTQVIAAGPPVSVANLGYDNGQICEGCEGTV
jgi:hypothetical protein